MREIGKGTERSVGTVHYHLDKLEVSGYITSVPNRARTYRVLGKEQG